MARIFLFDIDGVLVNPLAYRQGVAAVIREYAARWGYQGRLPGDEEIDLLESLHITSEWDQIPICLACILEEWLERTPATVNDFSLGEMDAPFFTGQANRLVVNFRERIRAIGELPRVNFAISDRLLDSPQVFPRLFRTQAYRELFANTRDVRRSQITRRFQLLELGSQVFRATYGLAAEMESDGLLLTGDRALVWPETAARLLDLRERGELNIAAITARPSLPKSLAACEGQGYSPEADLGLRVAGLDGMACIGFGELSWLAARLHTAPDRLLKPNRVHALAGIAAACGLDGVTAMQVAQRFDRTGARQDFDFLIRPDHTPAEIHIFEDTPVGVLAVQAAVDWLNENAFPAQVRAWGITQSSDKRRALESVHAVVHPTLEAALDVALEDRPG